MRACRLESASDEATHGRRTLALVQVHGGDVHLRRKLMFRRPVDICDDKPSYCEQEQGIEAKAFQAFPQCGHLTLACSRLFPQWAHGIKFPWGREKR